MKRRFFVLALILIVPFLHAVAQQKPPEAKWDVTAPLGPTTPLSFDTSEGTWMNVDVSPDGKRILFDLLGDIYEMPIDGTGSSPAKRVTSGAAFDMQRALQPGRIHSSPYERSRRSVEHLDHGRR